MSDGRVTYSKANFAAHVAYLAKTCADWAGSLMDDADANENADAATINRFTAEIRGRLNHYDNRAELLRAKLNPRDGEAA